MREYLYLWINESVVLNDFGGDEYLIKEKGFSLSSKFKISNDSPQRQELVFKYEKTNVPENFFSPNFSDIKAFVGENGSGKSIVMRLLYRIIGEGFENPINDVNGFVLFYTDDEEHIRYYKSPECPYRVIASFAKEDLEKNGQLPHKSPRSMFYTAAVNDVAIRPTRWTDCFDISTNSLLYLDSENRYNDAKLPKEYFSTYVMMEMMRKIKFAIMFYDDITNNESVKFRVPNAIRIELVKIDNYIVEKLSDEPEIKKQWLELAASIENFEDYFRLGILCNHIVGFPSDLKKMGKIPLIAKKPKEIKEMGLKTALQKYSNGNLLTEERKLSIKVEEILSDIAKINEEQQRALKEYKKIKPNLKGADGIFFDLNDPIHRSILSVFVEKCQGITWLTPFYIMKWRVQSSGEEAFIKFYSRFYDALKNYREPLESKDIHLFLDEADLYLHPEWQRCWMYEFIKVMGVILKRIYPSNTPKIQMFISTHSPFIITDFPKENIVLLKRTDGHSPLEVLNESQISPFGANLYDLLSESFFLKNSIGLFSEKKIQNLILLKKKRKKSESDEYATIEKECQYIEFHIGDPVVRSLVKKMEK